jgi:hypothetical protein
VRPVGSDTRRAEVNGAAGRPTLAEREAADVAIGLGIPDEDAEAVAPRPGLEGPDIEAGLETEEVAVELGRQSAAAAELRPLAEGATQPAGSGPRATILLLGVVRRPSSLHD